MKNQTVLSLVPCGNPEVYILQMPKSLATPASTNMSQGEERQKSLASSEPLHGRPLLYLRGTAFSVDKHLRPKEQLSCYTEPRRTSPQWLSGMAKRRFPAGSNAAPCFPPDCKFLKLVLSICTLLVGCFKFKLFFCPTHIACGLF